MLTTFEELNFNAKINSSTYGICSNLFLDQEFQTVEYQLSLKKLDDNSFIYDEDSLLKIKNQEQTFHHTEKITMKRA